MRKPITIIVVVLIILLAGGAALVVISQQTTGTTGETGSAPAEATPETDSAGCTVTFGDETVPDEVIESVTGGSGLNLSGIQTDPFAAQTTPIPEADCGG